MAGFCLQMILISEIGPVRILYLSMLNGVADWRVQGFYFIAKSSSLIVMEEEAHLTYGMMEDVLKGESFSWTFPPEF